MHQDALFYGAVVHPWSWFLGGLLAAGLFTVGYGTFGKLKPGFGNCL
jgi:hypothetical protein